jgi:transposase
MGQQRHPRGPKKLPRAELERRVLALAGMGLSQRAIAEQVGSSASTCGRIVSRQLEALAAEIKSEAHTLRAQHLMELRSLRQRLSKATAAGDIKAISTWIRVQEREAKLCGLDLQAAAVDDAAQHNAARALIDELSGKLEPDVMDRIVGILAAHAPAEQETDAE